MKRILFAAALAATAASTACMPPKVLVSNSMGSKYILQEKGPDRRRGSRSR